MELAPDTNQHVKKALPPTLTGYPGEADIKYYVKATVVRPKFYQENLRFQVDIKFLPIEPPRPPDRREETFARRKQQFAKSFILPQKKSLFRKSPLPDAAASEEPPSFQVDARLPNPPIITCNEPLPLRILVQKLSESSTIVYLGMLQIELIGYTHVRAHDLTRTESNSWVLMSQSNMNMPLGNAADPAFKEWKVPSTLWESIPLPNTVAPSFDTCNISRTYEIEVRVGLAHGEVGAIKPELIVLPLRLPVKVYSGIEPPPALLRAISTSLQPGYTNGTPQTPQQENPSPHTPHHPVTPMTPSTPTTPSYTQSPAQQGSYGQFPLPALNDEAPPSYEDAMAEDIAPVDGPRRDYSTPVTPSRRYTAFAEDSKGVHRRPSERLFASNDLHRPSRAYSLGRSTSPVTSTFPILEEDTTPVDGPWLEYSTPPTVERRSTTYEDDSKGVNRRQSERLFASNDIHNSSRTSVSSHLRTPVPFTFPNLEERRFNNTGQVLPDDNSNAVARKPAQSDKS